MIKFIEMDKNVTINNQIKEEQENKNGDSVILINKFDVSPDKIEQFLKDWADDVNSRIAKYNDSLVISSHLFRKAVVPGINKD